MNRDQPDRLFKRKLSSYEIAPPASSWDKLESRLQNKRKPSWLWTRIAAAVLLVAISAWIVIGLVNDRSSENSELAEQVQTAKPSTLEENIKKETTTPRQTSQPVEEVEKNEELIKQEVTEKPESTPLTNNPKPSPSPSNSARSVRIDSTVKPNVDNNERQLAIQTPDPELVQENDQTAPEGTIQEVETAPALTSIADNTLVESALSTEAKRTPIKITYKRSSENSELALVADSTENKELSGIKKVFQKAQQLKNNEINIGKLRAAKNSLLAFRGDKNNKQSKSN